jgi:hypothetical protein
MIAEKYNYLDIIDLLTYSLLRISYKHIMHCEFLQRSITIRFTVSLIGV